MPSDKNKTNTKLCLLPSGKLSLCFLCMSVIQKQYAVGMGKICTPTIKV